MNRAIRGLRADLVAVLTMCLLFGARWVLRFKFGEDLAGPSISFIAFYLSGALAVANTSSDWIGNTGRGLVAWLASAGVLFLTWVTFGHTLFGFPGRGWATFILGSAWETPGVRTHWVRSVDVALIGSSFIFVVMYWRLSWKSRGKEESN
jgi:hypothetical protein